MKSALLNVASELVMSESSDGLSLPKPVMYSLTSSNGSTQLPSQGASPCEAQRQVQLELKDHEQIKNKQFSDVKDTKK